MGFTVLRLVTAGILPVILAAVLYLMEQTGRFSRLSHPVQQLIIGTAFGAAAILATELGIPLDGAIVNVRNAAPLTAGLIFGWPAGILSGLIGSVHRWLSPVGDFTRVACTIATFMAGIMGASVRKFMMDDKKASWLYGLMVGVTAEVLHMLLVFLTNASEIDRAFHVVQSLAVAMILCNAISVMLAILVISFLARSMGKLEAAIKNISQTFQRWLLLSVVMAFAVTSLFTHAFQTQISFATINETLRASIQDVRQDIRDASDRNLLDLVENIARALPDNLDNTALTSIARFYSVSEINLINEAGIVTHSTDREIIGFDMHSGQQAAEFLCLLQGTESMVQDYQQISRESSVYRKYAGLALPQGFVQVGYDAEAFHDQIYEQVRFAAQNRRIGQKGSIIICNENGVIVSDRDGHQGEHISVFGDREIAVDEEERFSTTLYGEKSYCMYAQAEGYYIIGVIPQDEAMLSRNASVYMLAFMEVLVFATLFVMIFFLIKKLIVEKIREINRSLARITGGDLNVMVSVRDNEEFASLSDDINTTVATLKHYIDEAEARLDQELEIARKIQYSALPSVFPPYPNRTDFGIFAMMTPAREVGGDFYDFFLLNERQLAFSVADVSGKGIPGAMFMMNAKSVIKGLAESGLPIDEVFTRANAQLCENNDAGMFVTAWMGILDLDTGLVRFANAGHNPPAIRRKNGQYELIRCRANFVLAGMEGITYREQQLQLNPGDELYLYTDGVTEAHNEKKELYGEKRLLKCLEETKGAAVEEICRSVKKDMDVFVGDTEQFDDITMLCLRLNDLQEENVFTARPTMESVADAAAFAQEQVERMEVPTKIATRVMVMVDEIYSNIARYSGAEKAQLLIEKAENCLRLVFRDDGKPYNPLAAEEPDVSASAEEREIGGLGIFMVRRMADQMDYEYRQGMNRLTLILRLPEKK